MNNVGNHQHIVGTIELDNIPPGMPIIGLLVMIWRDIAKTYDMTEELMDVFDNAIAGATPLANKLHGVSKTMAYSDQITGLIDTPIMWQSFIDRMISVYDADRNQRGNQFIVQIQDVHSAQKREVEQVIKRLSHRRITYDIHSYI